ncbi:DUF7282 domain-containing protein [Halorubrum vacuolatum]|uniref:Ig-like domain-containing protein n=1 Tax=Halorubrum vacuolatum TaxID=63740 RepID=A0A238W4V3_HALVU|nr:hypothetical protein [Halorubrum vacuolatum]SNR41582.1 hypothetical protein SAMN06264855_105126 [Halorubrum vacuolatum]
MRPSGPPNPSRDRRATTSRRPDDPPGGRRSEDPPDGRHPDRLDDRSATAGTPTPSRRGLLTGLGTVAVLGSTAASAAGDDAVRLRLSAVGSTAWEAESEDDPAVVATDGENPELRFAVDTRYVVENPSFRPHPFELQDADGEPLLSQDAGGRFEDAPDVDWSDDGETMSFTVTESLAADLDGYVCTAHSRMSGSVGTHPDDRPEASVTFDDGWTPGRTVRVAAAELEDGGYLRVHDPDDDTGTRGVTEPLSAGRHEDVSIELDSSLSGPTTLAVTAHLQTTEEAFTFPDDGDGPYLDSDDDPVTVTATVSPIAYDDPEGRVSIERPEPDATVEPTVTVAIDVDGFDFAVPDTPPAPDRGGFVVLVDRDPVSPGDQVPEADIAARIDDPEATAEPTLDPGDRTVRVQAVDTERRAFTLTDDVAVTVADDDSVDADDVSDDDDSTDDGAPDEDSTGEDTTDDDGTDVDAPGFGVGVTLGALGGAVAYAYRRVKGVSDDGTE